MRCASPLRLQQGARTAVKALQQQHVNQHHQRGGEENPAVAAQRRHRGAEQRTGDVAEIHKRLVVAEDTAGNVVTRVAHQQRLHRRHHRAVGKAEQKAQHAELGGAGDERHGDQQQQRRHHGRQQNTLGADAVAQPAEARRGNQRRDAGQRGDNPAEKGDIVRRRRQLAHEQRQNRVNRAVAHLDHHRGDKQAEHQPGVIKRGEHLAPAQLLLFTDRLIAGLFNQQQRYQEAHQQQRGSNDKDHAQADPVRQQPTEHRPKDHPADLAGGDAAQRPAAAVARHLRRHQRHGVGDITRGQPHQGAQQQQLPGLGDKGLQQDHYPHA